MSQGTVLVSANTLHHARRASSQLTKPQATGAPESRLQAGSILNVKKLVKAIGNLVTMSHIASGIGVRKWRIMELVHAKKPTSILMTISWHGKSRLNKARPRTMPKETCLTRRKDTCLTVPKKTRLNLKMDTQLRRIQ